MSPPPMPGASVEVHALYDWMELNGVSELLPRGMFIDVSDGQLTYLAFRWDGARGYQKDNVYMPADEHEHMTEERTVPLLSPVTPEFRRVCELLGIGLSE